MSDNVRLLVGHEDGLTALRGSDGGKTWSDPELVIPEVAVTALAKLDGELYAGTRGAGIFHRPMCAGSGTVLMGTEPPAVYEWVGRRGDSPTPIVVPAQRQDVLRRPDGGWKLARRLVLLDATVLGLQSLPVFLQLPQ